VADVERRLHEFAQAAIEQRTRRGSDHDPFAAGRSTCDSAAGHLGGPR
jgi:hypothetical protein